MGLITKEVEIKVSGHPSYYENLGYDVPKHKVKISKEHPNGYAFTLNEKFTVKVKDLFKGSNIKVEVVCDCCGKIKSLMYSNVVKNKAFKDGKYYCNKCVGKIYLYGKHTSNHRRVNTDRIGLEYRMFKRNVLYRDNYKCVCCGKKSPLEVHHLYSYNKYKDKIYEVSNGVTLCKNCHANFHNLYGKGNNTKEQFEEWFGSTKEILSKNPNIVLSSAKEIYCFETDSYYDGTIDVLTKLHLSRNSDSEIYSCCNLKGNKCSVRGYRFLWGEIARKMSKDEIEDYILNNLDNPRRPFVLDLKSGLVFYNALERDRYYNLKLKTSARYMRKHKFNNNFNLECILYCDFIKLSEKQQKCLLKENKISIYKTIPSID